MNKSIKILAGRSGMLGDTLAAVPVATYFKKKYPDSQIIFPIGKRFAQGAPLYINHKDIDTVFVFDGDERPESKRDWDMVNSCNIVINPTPEHPDNIYPSARTIYKESFLMAGLSEDQWNSLNREEQRPKLYKWWKKTKAPPKTIAYWPQAGYGLENKRNASLEWRKKLIGELSWAGYRIWQFGAEKDDSYGFDDSSLNIQRFNHLSLFEQIKLTLSTDLMIGTDSGSALIVGAYEHPQISLLTNHWREDQDPHALEVDNPNNFSFWEKGSADNIKIDLVLDKVLELVK
jgi:ADP-heptose:LPS heptosyltransferase